MTPCPTCGNPQRSTVTRGGLTAKDEPHELFWRGIKIPIGPMRVRIVSLLLRFGRVSSGALEMLLGEDTGSKALTVHMHYIRATFRQHGVEAVIENIRGWGYKIEVAA